MLDNNGVYYVRRLQFGVNDALTQLGSAAVVGLVYGLLVMFATIFMKMKTADRLTIFISSFICMMVTFFAVFFLMYIVYYPIVFLSVGLLLLVLAEGFIYKKLLTYKKMNGFLVALITNVVTIVLYFLFSYVGKFFR